VSDKNTDFPQYRKLPNNKAFYRINSDRDFDEVQVLGSKVLCYHHDAKQYPEILRIMSMMDCEEPFVIADVDEFDGYNKRQ
jgi:hypothetical protein